jgi:uncharacterized protein (UPF0332 family)
MEERISRYRKLNGKYLKDADRLLKKGDYSRACEKYWGAVAEITKAYALRRGRNLKTHSDLWDFVIELHKKFPALGLHHDFADANHLHSNFYEDELRPETIELLSRSAKTFIKKIGDLMQD